MTDIVNSYINFLSAIAHNFEHIFTRVNRTMCLQNKQAVNDVGGSTSVSPRPFLV